MEVDKEISTDDEKTPTEWLNWPEEADEEKVYEFLGEQISEAVEVEKVDNGYRKIFYPDKLWACILSFPKLKVINGHYEMTEEVCKTCGVLSELNDHTVKNFARASRLPDLMYFDKLVYHAQSETDEQNKTLTEFGDGDRDQFAKFLQSYLDSLDKAIASADFEEIYFIVGVLFHAIQDLGCHQGMTNPEHSYYNKQGCSPDADSQRYKFGLQVNQQFANRFIATRLVNVKDQLNQTGRIHWRKRYLQVGYIKFIKDALKFKHAALAELKDKNMGQWFKWRGELDNKTALQEIDKYIFQHIK